ncbi:hypothetical protein GCM10010112_64070 [Actinoplanes lobatus]|uniref:Uncharacterized protein n=1 Tax=Actinoplanes lobatus TaxID=113568 RepID=A0A7W7MKZ2_9ACTN|nr:hypothetical protein [Actinoplanes lobatus]MBB4753600.1 hypothetical protein [Actinoplanes lobatus]GGN84587.1 hypothetical protein GCM10010112_64070 [Actinoplanes lobatus]GIE38137.1 hypothetical protein Alo02nite_10350 [Actinoplanes lobatus]
MSAGLAARVDGHAGRLLGSRPRVPGARLVTYPGMGRDLPRLLQPAIAGEIAYLATRTGQSA